MLPNVYVKHPGASGLTLDVVEDFFQRVQGDFLSQRTPNCGSSFVFLLGWVCFVWGF